MDARALTLRIRQRGRALQLLVLALWVLGSIGLTALLTSLSLMDAVVIGSGVNRLMMTSSIYAGMSMTSLAPLAVWAGRALERRELEDRMALVADEDAELGELAPELRALAADARLARSAIEGREFDDEVALRAVWEWLQRRATLPERERRELEDRGLDALGIEDTLRWTIEAPGRSERGLALIAEELGAFERGLVLASRGPYR